ncbi:MAG: HD domain-containing protein, partial [Spirochaetales bacterium]|nr:HD domain-containing protein [Spirochaetales bacterium]
ECEKIHIAAHLHDIGKIGVPDAVLKKEGRLTDEEFEEIKKHSVIGAEILAHSKRLSELCDLVRHHHERYDGRGYPDKLAAEDIPYGARIIAVCDSIDAMTSNRCYRKAIGFDSCRSEIERNRGLMYDPHITDVVIGNWEKVIGVITKKVIS